MSQPRAKGRRRRRLGTSWGSRSPEDTWLHRRRPGKAVVGEPTWTPRRAQASDLLPAPPTGRIYLDAWCKEAWEIQLPVYRSEQGRGEPE